jgi:regulator of protease activity HflC (stomatin/prohibitin superfamily)
MNPFLIVLLVIIGIFVLAGVKIIKQYKRGVIFTLGKYTGTLQPGLKVVIPFVQRITQVDIRERAVDVPSQEAMTKDNISCSINAVIYYKIKADQVDRAVINVANLGYAMSQFAQTTMRNIVGRFELDELLSNREEASQLIKEIVDTKSDERGVDVLSVELKDIIIPDNLKRTIGKQAEAEREKRAKIISSEGEVQSSANLQKAAQKLAEAPGALHLRTLQSINDLSSDQSNTTIWMVPVEMMEAIKGFGDTFTSKK